MYERGCRLHKKKIQTNFKRGIIIKEIFIKEIANIWKY